MKDPSKLKHQRMYPQPTLKYINNHYPVDSPDACTGEIVAITGSSFGHIFHKVYDSHKNMVAQAQVDFGPGNVWTTSTYARMPYPNSTLWSLASVFKGEQQTGRKVNWIVWIDDDMVVERPLVRKLRNCAHPIERPFVAVACYDRYPPHHSTVWEMKEDGLQRWRDLPNGGLYKVHTTGLGAAIFHRSLFDKLPQPWFVASPDMVKDDAVGADIGMRPDVWWCGLLHKHNIPVIVTCDMEITHLGSPVEINRKTVPMLRQYADAAGKEHRKDDPNIKSGPPENAGKVKKGQKLIELLHNGKRVTFRPDYNKKILIGLGTGRSGTKSLSMLLNEQPDTLCGHEGFRGLRPTECYQGLLGHVGAISVHTPTRVGNVAFYYLPHVEKIMKIAPKSKFICMKRDKDATRESALKWSPNANLWSEHDGTKWVIRTGIDELFPKFKAKTPEEAHDKYWDWYYKEAGRLQEKYPKRFRIFDIEDLNTKKGVNSILSFAGIPVKDRKHHVGVKANATK